VVHLSPLSSAFCLSTTTTQRHKVTAAQVWWLNLIIEMTTVSVIHVQKNSKYQNDHIKVMSRKLLASLFRGHHVKYPLVVQMVIYHFLLRYSLPFRRIASATNNADSSISFVRLLVCLNRF